MFRARAVASVERLYAGQTQDFSPEGRVMTRPFGRRGFFHEVGKLTPSSLLFYPTSSEEPLTAPRKPAVTSCPLLFMVISVLTVQAIRDLDNPALGFIRPNYGNLHDLQRLMAQNHPPRRATN